MIGGLLGQHIEPFEAAKLGVYLHGMSGDIMAEEKGTYSLMASDIITGISRISGLYCRKEGYTAEKREAYCERI